MNNGEQPQTEFQEVHAKAMQKGHLTLDDIFREYRAAKDDIDQLERDLRWLAGNRPRMDINSDVSLERARLEALKPPGYDEWPETAGRAGLSGF